MSPPTWTSLPIPPLQVVTESWFEFPESYSKFPLAIYLTHGKVCFHVSLSIPPTLSFFPAPPLPPAMSTSLFSVQVSILFQIIFLFRWLQNIEQSFLCYTVGHYVCVCVCAQWFSHVQFFVTLWTIVFQALLSMGFSRQEYWSGLPFPPPGRSSWPRDWTLISCVYCIERWILYH